MLAGVSALDVATTERQRNGLLQHIRDRLRRAAVALLTLSDQRLIDNDTAELGRGLVANVDELLAVQSERGSGVRFWLDEGKETEPVAQPTEPRHDGIVPEDAPRSKEAPDHTAAQRAPRATIPVPPERAAQGTSAEGPHKTRRRRKRRQH